MLIHCWNVRGLNNPLKQHEVVNLMKKNRTDVCGLVETKLISSKVSFMHRFRLGNWKFLTYVGAANNARILVF
jgi:exonuclease III